MTFNEKLQMLDGVKLNFNSDSSLLLNLTIALIMLGVALELKWADFKLLLEKPKSAGIGIASQFVILPLLTFLLTVLFKDFITPTVGLGNDFGIRMSGWKHIQLHK